MLREFITHRTFASLLTYRSLHHFITFFPCFSKKGVTEIVDLDMDHNIGK